MKNLLIAILTLLTVNWAVAQNKETRKLRSFNEISVGESIKLYIEKGSTNSARIETEGVDTDKVLTDVNGSSLDIHMERGNYRNRSVEVYLTFTEELEELSAGSSASLIGKSVVKSDDLEIRVNSSGKMDIQVEAGELDVEVSSSGKAELEVTAQEVDVEVSSSGKLEISGSTNYQKFQVSSSGKLYAYNLKSKRVSADISSSGNAEINVSDELIANASSSGRISYRGNPEKVLVDTNSSGKVRKAD